MGDVLHRIHPPGVIFQIEQALCLVKAIHIVEAFDSLTTYLSSEQSQTVKPGDASMALPFTAKKSSVMPCTDIIRHGRHHHMCPTVSCIQNSNMPDNVFVIWAGSNDEARGSQHGIALHGQEFTGDAVHRHHPVGLLYTGGPSRMRRPLMSYLNA